MSPVEEPAADATAAARAVAGALQDALGENLLAVYLHGSAVLGGFRWDRSDLDVLAVSRGTLSDVQIRRVAASLVRLSYPANGLEFSLMTIYESIAPGLPAPQFQLHVSTAGSAHAGTVVDGRSGAGDSDLVLHLAVARQRGMTLLGPPPEMTIAPIPADTLLLAMRDEIGWARANAPLEYLVLTSARAWLFAETHQIASKIEAGEWAARRYVEPGVIVAALGRQRGSDVLITTDAAELFAKHVQRLVASGDAPSDVLPP